MYVCHVFFISGIHLRNWQKLYQRYSRLANKKIIGSDTFGKQHSNPTHQGQQLRCKKNPHGENFIVEITVEFRSRRTERDFTAIDSVLSFYMCCLYFGIWNMLLKYLSCFLKFTKFLSKINITNSLFLDCWKHNKI